MLLVWLASLGWLGGWCWCRGFFDNDSVTAGLLGGWCQFCFLSGDVALIDVLLAHFWWVGGEFSMESLILAQDERWRRA